MFAAILLFALTKLSLATPADYQSLTGNVPYKIVGLGAGATEHFRGAPRGEDVAFLLEAMSERAIACEYINSDNYINDDNFNTDIGDSLKQPFPSVGFAHLPIWEIANYSHTPMQTNSVFKCCAWDTSVFLSGFFKDETRGYYDDNVMTNLFWGSKKAGTKSNVPPFKRYNASYYYWNWKPTARDPTSNVLASDRICAFYCDLRDNEAIPFSKSPRAIAGRTIKRSAQTTSEQKVQNEKVVDVTSTSSSVSTNAGLLASMECFARAHGNKQQYEIYYADYDPNSGSLPTGKEGTIYKSWPLTNREEYEYTSNEAEGGFYIRFPPWFADRIVDVKCYAVMQFYHEAAQYEISPTESEDYGNQRFIVIDELATSGVSLATNGFANVRITTDIPAMLKTTMNALGTGQSAKAECDERMASLPFPEVQEMSHPDTLFVNSVTVVKRMSLLRIIGIARMRYHARTSDVQ